MGSCMKERERFKHLLYICVYIYINMHARAVHLHLVLDHAEVLLCLHMADSFVSMAAWRFTAYSLRAVYEGCTVARR